MADIIRIAKAIERYILLLDEGRKALSKAACESAQADAEYDKQMALTIVKLKNGVSIQYEGQEVLNPPATVLERIARGICWEYKLAMEKKQAGYKAVITKLNVIQSQLNALQSLYRHLDESP
jgi:hypothetical protein